MAKGTSLIVDGLAPGEPGVGYSMGIVVGLHDCRAAEHPEKDVEALQVRRGLEHPGAGRSGSPVSGSSRPARLFQVCQVSKHDGYLLCFDTPFGWSSRGSV